VPVGGRTVRRREWRAALRSPVAVGVAAAVLLVSAGCGADRRGATGAAGSAPLRGFGVQVDQAVAARVPAVHLATCGSWGCHEQDVPLSIAGPTSAGPCPSAPTGPAGAACGVVQLPGPGPGFGYAPVPPLTVDPVTVVVTTPPGAPLVINARVRVRPRLVCPDGSAGSGAASPGGSGPAACAGGAPQAQLRIAADGTVSQSR
jgi:hypothetical protein